MARTLAQPLSQDFAGLDVERYCESGLGGSGAGRVFVAGFVLTVLSQGLMLGDGWGTEGEVGWGDDIGVEDCASDPSCQNFWSMPPSYSKPDSRLLLDWVSLGFVELDEWGFRTWRFCEQS